MREQTVFSYMRNGYRMIFMPNHPKTTELTKYVAEHILIAENALGRFLPAGTEIHHFNNKKADNTKQNLVICAGRAYHMLLHARSRIADAGGDPNTQKICSTCSTLKMKAEFYARQRSWDGRREECIVCEKASHAATI